MNTDQVCCVLQRNTSIRSLLKYGHLFNQDSIVDLNYFKSGQLTIIRTFLAVPRESATARFHCSGNLWHMSHVTFPQSDNSTSIYMADNHLSVTVVILQIL